MKNTILVLILFASIAFGFTSCAITASVSETHSQTFTLGETSYCVDNAFLLRNIPYHHGHGESLNAIVLSQSQMVSGFVFEGMGIGIVFRGDLYPGTYSASSEQASWPKFLFVHLDNEALVSNNNVYDFLLHAYELLNIDTLLTGYYGDQVYLANSGCFTIEKEGDQFTITTDGIEVMNVVDPAIIETSSVDYEGGMIEYCFTPPEEGYPSSNPLIVAAGRTLCNAYMFHFNIASFITENDDMIGFTSEVPSNNGITVGTYYADNSPIYFSPANTHVWKRATAGQTAVTREGENYTIDMTNLEFSDFNGPTSFHFEGPLYYFDNPLDYLDPFPEEDPHFIVPIASYGESNGGWNFIASPVEDNLSPRTILDLINSTTSNYDLYRFNQSAEAEWENHKAHTDDFVFENGKGYLYANKDSVNLYFSGTMNNDATKTVNLEYDPNARFKGWNLVGNPFTVPAVVNRSFYIMNASGTGLVPQPVSAGETIAAGVGIMVKANGTNETVTFTTPTRQNTANNGLLRIAVDNEDQVVVSFNPGDQLAKFYFGKQNANLYIPKDHEEYGIAYSEQIGEMPVNFKALKNGVYTITVNPEAVEMEYLHLIDNLTDKDINLLENPSYTFESNVLDYPSRFKLVFNAQPNGEDHFAHISNDEIIVTGTGTIQVFDLQGRNLLTQQITPLNSHLSTLNFSPGVYVLRLTEGNIVKTQKIVIE